MHLWKWKWVPVLDDLTRNEQQADCSDPGSGLSVLTPSSAPCPSLPSLLLLHPTDYTMKTPIILLLSRPSLPKRARNFEKPQLHVYTQNTALQPTTWSARFSTFLLNWYHYLKVSNNTMEEMGGKRFFLSCFFFFKSFTIEGKDAILQSFNLF